MGCFVGTSANVAEMVFDSVLGVQADSQIHIQHVNSWRLRKKKDVAHS